MNKTDILIENTINDYLIKEGFKDWFSRKPKIKLTRFDGDYLYGTDGKSEEEIPIFLSFKNDKVKRLEGKINGKWKPIKIANMPREGEVVYYGICDFNNQIYYGFDNEFNQIRFMNYNGTFYEVFKEDNQWLPYDDGEISKVYFFNEESNYQQGEGQDNEEIDYGSNDDVIYTETDSENDSESSVRRVPSNDDEEDDSEEDGNTNDDAEYRASILNPQEEYPLSNALMRLVRQRELRDSRRVRNLMRDLNEIGY